MKLKESPTPALRPGWARFILLPLALMLIIIALTMSIDCCSYRGRIYPGVHVNGIPLGGLSLEEAADRLTVKLCAREELKLAGLEEGEISLTLAGLGISWDRGKTMELIGRAGSGRSGYCGRLRRLWNNAPLQLEGVLKLDKGKLRQKLKDLAERIEQEPQDAGFVVRGAEVTIREGRSGRYLQAELLEELLLDAALQGCSTIELPIGIKEPEITAAKLSRWDLDGVMVAFTSTVSQAIPNRVHNIMLGAEAINGCLLPPGGVFSFEAVVGDSTREKGYREAPVIVGGKLVPGLGGGLCQVSSTLYNAALLANLTIVERYNHSLTIGYLPIGRDATISIGYADLKFRNNRDHYILIGAELENDQLTFRIFGPPMQERVEIYSTDIVTLEPPVQYERSDALPEGTFELVQRGKAGYRVKTWRAVYRGEEEISRELLSHDHYRPVPTIYRVGTGE